MGQTTNRNYPAYDSDETSVTFLKFRTDIAGSEGSALSMIDADIKDVSERLGSLEGVDVSETEIEFEESATAENITSGNTIKTVFGKLSKWFSDLKALAWKDTVSTDEIEENAVTNDKLATMAPLTFKANIAKSVTAVPTDVSLSNMKAVLGINCSGIGALPTTGGDLEGSLSMKGNSLYIDNSEGVGPYMSGGYDSNNVPYLEIMGSENDEAVVISSVATPTADNHAANKSYVDSKPTIYVSTAEPTSADGKDGDIWVVYEES